MLAPARLSNEPSSAPAIKAESSSGFMNGVPAGTGLFFHSETEVSSAFLVKACPLKEKENVTVNFPSFLGTPEMSPVSAE